MQQCSSEVDRKSAIVILSVFRGGFRKNLHKIGLSDESESRQRLEYQETVVANIFVAIVLRTKYVVFWKVDFDHSFLHNFIMISALEQILV